MFENVKRKIHGIAFYRVYYKPLGEQTGWSKYGDAYDGMPTSIPQDRFFDIEDPPKNRTYLCVGIKKDGKWAIGSDIPGTWKKKHGEDESSAGESKAELKKRLEKLEKTAGEGKTPSTEEIAGIIILNHINKKIESGDETIWSVVGQMLNPQSNNSNDSYNPFAETKLEIDGKMPWYMHPAIATTYMQGLPKFAEELSSSFIKGAKKEMAKGEQLPQQSSQQQYQEQEYVEPTEEEPLDIEVRPKSNTITRILAERAAEKEALEKNAVEKEAEEEIPSEARAVAERFGAAEEEEGAIETVPKSDIKEPSEPEEAFEPQTETKKTLIERARDRIAAKKKIEVEEAGTKQDIKEQSEVETEEMLEVGIEGKGEEGNSAEEEETEEEIAKKEMIRKRTEKAMATRARNKAARERKAEEEEIEVEA